MLISCPKCHSIYEIPDDLIGKTGKNFRCQACANVWHAMKSDALGYEEEKENEPFIEPLPVAEPPVRNYPANKDEFNVPADGKSGRRTPSSSQILAEEGDPSFTIPQNTTQPATPPAEVPEPPQTLSSTEIMTAARQKREITLTSDYGTSFTISMAGAEPAAEAKEPRLSAEKKTEGLSATPDDHLAPPKPFKGYRKTCAFIGLLFVCACLLLLRREVVIFYPAAEAYYQKIGLSGINNPEYLKFEQIAVAEDTAEGKDILRVTAIIKNASPYTTLVPDVTVGGQKETFAPERKLLKGGESAKVAFDLPAPQPNAPISLTLGFNRP